MPCSKLTDTFSKSVCQAGKALTGIIFADNCCITQRGTRLGKIRKTERRPVPVNGLNLAKGSVTWGVHVFFSCPFSRVMSTLDEERGCES